MSKDVMTALKRQLVLLELVRSLDGPEEVNAVWDLLHTKLRQLAPKPKARKRRRAQATAEEQR